MPTTPQSGMRRLEEHREAEPTLNDLEKIIYGSEAAQSLLEFVRQPLKRATVEVEIDRCRQMLFEGAGSSTPNEAPARA